jgi:hypothetical protein
MKKEFIPYEQALALKELGFDEPCLASYETAFGKGIDFELGYIINGPKNYVLAPLYQQAFRWFREKYNINGHFWDSSISSSGAWRFTLTKLEINMHRSSFICEKCRFKTPEEAELECLIKLIEIVKSK